MQNIDIIQNSIDFIEENLKSSITINELSEMSGYSSFHYLRIFKKTTGITVSQYITKRKLLHAAFEIADGSKITETALSYGFETNAGFYKAFINEFGTSPSKYSASHKVRYPYKLKLIQEKQKMINHNKIENILANWNIKNETITDFYYNNGRRADNVWYIGNDKILKTGTDLKRLNNNILLSKILYKNNLSTALPILTNNDTEYYYDGETYFYLCTRLTGTPVPCSQYYHSFELPFYTGKIIGQLDLALNEIEKNFTCTETDTINTLISGSIPKLCALGIISNSFSDEFINDFLPLYNKLPKQIIHRDLNPNNIIFNNGKLSGFIDFELSQKNIRIFDPCYTSTAILSETFSDENFNSDKWMQLLKNIINGYDSVNKLNEYEKTAVPFVIISNQINFTAFFTGIEKYNELAEINQKMLKYLISNFEKLRVLL